MSETRVRLALGTRLSLRFQHLVAYISLPIWYTGCVIFMWLFRGYRLKHLKKIREQYRQIKHSHQHPLLICANHLSKIDSLIIMWGLSSLRSYLLQFRSLPWNLPERSRYKNNPFFRLICYFGCCIPISRGGDKKSVNKSLDKIRFLLQHQQAAMIFPEGKRSITGKIDRKDFAYGVGRIVKSIKNCSVLCIYMRGHMQTQQSAFPKRGNHFSVQMALIHPESQQTGVRGSKAIATQIIDQLITMEDAYFAAYR